MWWYLHLFPRQHKSKLYAVNGRGSMWLMSKIRFLNNETQWVLSKLPLCSAEICNRYINSGSASSGFFNVPFSDKKPPHFSHATTQWLKSAENFWRLMNLSRCFFRPWKLAKLTRDPATQGLLPRILSSSLAPTGTLCHFPLCLRIWFFLHCLVIEFFDIQFGSNTCQHIHDMNQLNSYCCLYDKSLVPHSFSSSSSDRNRPSLRLNILLWPCRLNLHNRLHVLQGLVSMNTVQLINVGVDLM